MSKIDYKEEIRRAKAEMAKWPDSKKSSIRLEGTDKYFDQHQQVLQSYGYNKKIDQKNK